LKEELNRKYQFFLVQLPHYVTFSRSITGAFHDHIRPHTFTLDITHKSRLGAGISVQSNARSGSTE
jgi:hypothetical protein